MLETHRSIRFGRLLAALALALAIVGGVVLPARPASAHAAALSSEPAPGTTLEASPTQILVRFGAPVEIGVGAFRLVDAAGASVKIGAATHPGGEKNAVAATVPTLVDGGYAAIYQVVSADGHITRGAFTFQVGKTSTAIASGLVTELTTTNDKGPLAAVALLARLMTFAGALAATGGLLFLARCWPAGGHDRIAQRFLRIAGIVCVIGSVAMLATGAGLSVGRGLAGIFDSAGWRNVLSSRPGRWWVVRSVGAAILAVGLLAGTRSTQRNRSIVGLVGAVVLFVGMAKGGHGTSGRWPLVGVLLTVVHLLAASCWVGGLAMALRSLIANNTDGVAALRRFSPMALVSVIVVWASGSLQAWRQLRDWSGWTSRYGLSLRNKIVVVAVLVAIGGASRVLLRRTTKTRQAAPPAATIEPVDRPEMRLRDLVGLEVLFGAGVLALTMSLVNIPPPAAPAPQPFSTQLVVGTRTADIIVEPAGVGVNTVHVTVTNNDGSIRNPSNITIRLSLATKADLPPINAEPSKRLANHATFDNVVLPYAGLWKIEAMATFASETVRFSSDVKVR